MDCPHPGCHKHFSTKYNLARHEKVQHQGIRPFICQYCFKAFASKQNRLSHEYVHRTEPAEPIPPEVKAAIGPYETHGVLLTDLVKRCRDPDLRPFSKVLMIYYWPQKRCKKLLPALSPASTEVTDPLPKPN